MAAANPRTVVVVNSGGPVTTPWREEVAAVLLTWFPGQEFGHALADVLLGKTEPGGRLPTTWPARLQDVPVRSTRPINGALEQVIQIYLPGPGSSMDRPVIWLAGYGAVHAAAGQRVTAPVRVAARAFQHWSVENHRWQSEPGIFRVTAGASVHDQRLRCDVEVSQQPS